MHLNVNVTIVLLNNPDEYKFQQTPVKIKNKKSNQFLLEEKPKILQINPTFENNVPKIKHRKKFCKLKKIIDVIYTSTLHQNQVANE